MIYKEPQKFIPSITKTPFLLADLTILQRKHVQTVIQSISLRSGHAKQVIHSRLQHTLLSPRDLAMKISAVVLPPSCFTHPFLSHNGEQIIQNKLSVYEWLVQQYKSQLTIGIKLSQNTHSQMLVLKEQGRLKKVKLFSFDLQQQNMQKQLPFVRAQVTQLFASRKNVLFHINLICRSLQSVKSLKKEFIQGQYPIQSIVLQTNILNLLQKQMDMPLGQALGFNYCQCVAKYIPPAIGCLLDSYQGSTDTQKLLGCISFINKRKQNEKSEYRPWHKTGISFPQCILMEMLQQMQIDQIGYYKAIVWFDSKGYSALNEASVGKYERQTKFQFSQMAEFNQ